MGIRTDVSVEQCMSQPVETVEAETPLREAAELMRKQDTDALVVTEPRLILTSTDIVDAVAAGYDTSELSVEDAATDVIATISPQTSLTEAASMMLRNESSHLPVVDGDDIVGMLTQTDITQNKARDI